MFTDDETKIYNFIEELNKDWAPLVWTKDTVLNDIHVCSVILRSNRKILKAQFNFDGKPVLYGFRFCENLTADDVFQILKKGISLEDKVGVFVEKQDIDPSELNSYRYDSNPYGVDSAIAGGSSCWDWDEEEEFEHKKEQAIEKIEKYGAEEFLGRKYSDKKVIKIIESL